MWEPSTYPWHDTRYRPPAFHDFIIYQLHVATFYDLDANGQDKREQVAAFLDVVTRVPYLRELGRPTS